MKDDNNTDENANKRATSAIKQWHDEKLGFIPCTNDFVKYLSKYIPEYK